MVPCPLASGACPTAARHAALGSKITLWGTPSKVHFINWDAPHIFLSFTQCLKPWIQLTRDPLKNVGKILFFNFFGKSSKNLPKFHLCLSGLARLALRPTASATEQAEFLSQCGFSQKSTVQLRPSGPEVWKLHWAHPIIYFWPSREGRDSLSQASLHSSQMLHVTSLRETPMISQLPPHTVSEAAPHHPPHSSAWDPPSSLRAGFVLTDRRSDWKQQKEGTEGGRHWSAGFCNRLGAGAESLMFLEYF